MPQCTSFWGSVWPGGDSVRYGITFVTFVLQGEKTLKPNANVSNAGYTGQNVKYI